MSLTISDGKDMVVDLSAHIVKTEEDCVGSGRFGDVYKGIRNDKAVNDAERMVAIKIIRPITANKNLKSKVLKIHSARDPKITHGDVKTANTLVDRNGNPKLCDFGLSRLICEEDLWMTTTMNSRGSVRWMAPELLDGRQILPTSESDVYAFGMTVLEILTGKVPHHHHRIDGAVLLAVAVRKELPNRPAEIECAHLWQEDFNGLWECLIKCWDEDPGRRPSMAVLEELFRSGREEQVVRADVTLVGIPSEPFIGHTSPVMLVAFSPDGRRIASGSLDRSVHVWNVETGVVVLRPLVDKMGFAYSVAFSPNGKHLTAGCSDNTVRVWDAVTGEVASKPFKGHAKRVTSVAYSPDGRWIASGSDNMTVRVWNAVTGEEAGLFKGHTDCVTSVAFTPDGRRIASGSYDRTVRVWDAETGEVMSGPFEGHKSIVSSIMFSSDGKRIASGSLDNEVLVWDAETGKVVSGPFKGQKGAVNSVAFSPDGKRIASGSDDTTVLVWDAVTGKVVSGPFEGHTTYVNSVAFSPDGNLIASGSVDCTVRLWDART